MANWNTIEFELRNLAGVVVVGGATTRTDLGDTLAKLFGTSATFSNGDCYGNAWQAVLVAAATAERDDTVCEFSVAVYGVPVATVCVMCLPTG